MGLKTTPGKKKEIYIESKKPIREDQSITIEDHKLKSPRKKITFTPRNPTTTVIVHPMIQTTSTSIHPSYPPVITLGYSPPVTVITTITPYMPQIYPGYTYPDTNWTSIVSTINVPNPVYSLPMPPLPVTMISPMMSPQICPYTSVPSPYKEVPLASPMARLDSSVQDNGFIHCDQIVPSSPHYDKTFDTNRNQTFSAKKYKKQDVSDLGSYLRLPKELFPNARMLMLDPNPIINEFCYEDNIDKHSSWILDLEFGVPRVPVPRPIAMYDVQFNSVHCKNTPGAIHPTFETCSPDFKRALLFYYDCIISTWYKGFVEIYQDNSVAHFQNWLQKPMQVLGMCWP